MGENNGDELQLPIANVGRLMKKILPQKAKISKEAKATMQECATEFISFVTSEAAEKCHKDNRRTLNGDDICWAFGSFGLDNYAEASAKYLLKYRDVERINAQFKTNIAPEQQRHDQDQEQKQEQEQELEFNHGETSEP
ncbi:nuclear transcription factor Y subunit B-4-like [Cucurbita pepo subsp. pepo]|uniref:nuclear transcription factor Y subunit B-4-like n=1 Tax=Cucurbita pepo subsp. pepo TaxID=3664 RepID=UPI000C9D7F91|nr:nuclear transcription factor Y subunit B-4-like [Cucurbita pepo subsp. pepo]